MFVLYLAAAMFGPAPVGATQAGPPSAESATPASAADPAPSEHSGLLAEVVKQAVEQPLHFLMSAGPIWVSRCLTAVPWYGWAAVPALAYREWRQWPSKRWWDPALDAAFLILGVVAATWSRRAAPASLPLAAMRRRVPRPGFARLTPAMMRRARPAESASS